MKRHAKASSAGSSTRSKKASGIALFGVLLCLLVLAVPLAFAASAPEIEGTAVSLGTEEATLRASINPGGEATSYEFEWGPTAAYGETTSGNIPSGEASVAVSAALTGLTPGATYHYRLVADNGTDTTEGPDRTFTTLASVPSLGPKRAYELVSQYPTGGIPYYEGTFSVAVSEDGNRVHFRAPVPLPGSTLIPLPDQLHGDAAFRYGSVRGPNGWQVEEYGVAGRGGGGTGVSADGTRYLFATESGWENDARLDPDDRSIGSEGGTGTREVYQRQPDGSLVWISRDPRIPTGTPQTDHGDAEAFGYPVAADMSVDGTTTVFKSEAQLDNTDTTSGAFPRIYKWSDGKLNFIGVRPDGSVPVQGSGLGGSRGDLFANVRDAVSRDGARVLFNAARDDVNDARTLYIQTDGQPTVEAVKETEVPLLPNNQPFDVRYRGASSDLSRAFYTTASRLTPDSGAGGTSGGDADLYVYDIDADKVRDLTPRLDGLEDPMVDPAVGDRGRVRGVMANSEDGKRVYFVADAQYDAAPNPEGELPSSEGRNLYLAELDGIDDPIELRFIAALSSSDERAWQITLNGDNGGKSAYASPDGSVLGFGSSVPLTGQALSETEQLFVYDAEADTLECASCPSDGSLPVGKVNAVDGGLLISDQYWQNLYSIRRWVSSDGRVFFHAPTQLVPADTNLVDDVYEYLAGQVRLVSSGADGSASRIQDVSRDGRTVIFSTSEALAPDDEEPGIPKLYAARTGGGFPLVPKSASCDLGAGACEGPGTSAAQQPGAGSAAFEGPGDPKTKKAGRRCPKGKRKVRRKGKIRCAAKPRQHSHRRNARNDRRISR